MHNGAFGTLDDVVDFYNVGGVSNQNLDPLIKPLNLNHNELSALVEFLNSITGDNIDALVSDGLATPIGDVNLSGFSE